MLGFGFHYSIGGNKNGSGQFIDKLNAAGIPVMMKGASDAGLCFEAQEKGKQYGVENILVWRATSTKEDVPDYWLAPSVAAAKKWNEIQNLWPPELDKNLVWWEVINEPRKRDSENEEQPTWNNMHTTAWLGLFMVEMAKLMIPAGYKLCGPSFSSGEPEPEDWQLDGMATWLRYCADNPTKAVISHHEYNYGNVPYAENYPWHYGRFQAIIAAADKLGIPRTFSIFLTEFGWQERSVPSFETAVPVLTEYAKLSAKFPQLKGVALWTLQSNWGDISNQLAAWISNNGNPMTDWIMANQLPTMPQPQPTADEFGATLPQEETMKHKAIVVKLPQSMTTAEWNDAAAVAFGFRHTMTASHDDMLTVLQGGNAESFVKFSHPERDSVAVQMVEAAGYRWEPLYEVTEPELEIINIVATLPLGSTRYSRALSQINAIAIHHFASNSTIQQVHNYHLSLGWPGIGYHFVVDHDGKIYQTIPLDKLGTHVANHNTRSIGIALRGNFTSQAPSQAMLDSARDLVIYLKQLVPTITESLGHREFPGAATQCPGNTWQNWLPYITGDDIVITPPPVTPPAVKKYSTSFMRGEPGIWRVIRRFDGSGEDVWELPLSDNADVRVKNNNEGEWYEYRPDGIYRIRDTSPAPDSQGNDRLYLLSINDLPGGKIAPNEAELGETYIYTNEVQFKQKSDCANLAENSGLAVSTFKLVEVRENYTFPTTGFKVDRLYITEQTGEIQLYAEHSGRIVGWVGGGASQNNNVWGGELNELYFDRTIPGNEPKQYC